MTTTQLDKEKRDAYLKIVDHLAGRDAAGNIISTQFIAGPLLQKLEVDIAKAITEEEAKSLMQEAMQKVVGKHHNNNRLQHNLEAKFGSENVSNLLGGVPVPSAIEGGALDSLTGDPLNSPAKLAKHAVPIALVIAGWFGISSKSMTGAIWGAAAIGLAMTLFNGGTVGQAIQDINPFNKKGTAPIKSADAPDYTPATASYKAVLPSDLQNVLPLDRSAGKGATV